MMRGRIHSAPFNGKNNRKKTKGRIKDMSETQSIPVFQKDPATKITRLVGYKHIVHHKKLGYGLTDLKNE